MIYVMSDLHGMYSEYLEMLELINFKAEDSLYIIGDICDRGADSAKIYLDVMSRENVFCIKGNHEQMLEESLPHSFGWLRDLADSETVKKGNAELWDVCGGDSTKVSFCLLEREEDICRIYSFVKNLPCYLTVEVNGKRISLVHAGTYGAGGKRKLADFSNRELLCECPDYDGTFGDKDKELLIVGHTPTFVFREDKRAEIYHGKGNIIDIDCGAVFREDGGRLACLCLDDMQEYYV